MMIVKLTCCGTTIGDVIEALDDATRLMREGRVRGTSAPEGQQALIKTLTLTCRGKTADDIVAALKEVRRLVSQGVTSGVSRNSAGRFYFKVEDTAAAVPWWFYRLVEFDGLEIHPVQERADADDGFSYCEQCDPAEADFWSVYGHLTEGGVLCLEDFKAEAEARAFAETLLSAWPSPRSSGSASRFGAPGTNSRRAARFTRRRRPHSLSMIPSSFTTALAAAPMAMSSLLSWPATICRFRMP